MWSRRDVIKRDQAHHPLHSNFADLGGQERQRQHQQIWNLESGIWNLESRLNLPQTDPFNKQSTRRANLLPTRPRLLLSRSFMTATPFLSQVLNAGTQINSRAAI